MSLTNFSAIDMARLPAPKLIEPLSFDEIKTAIVADFSQRYDGGGLDYASDPAIKLIEAFAYREMLIRQRINEAAEAVLLAKASGAELDYLGARFGVSRALLSSGDASATPPVPSEYESDERYRERVRLALEGFSTAGPAGAYVFHAMKASPNVRDVYVCAPEFEHSAVADDAATSAFVLNCTSSAGLSDPMPGDVAVTILSDEGTGQASPALLNTVQTYLNQDEIRPLTDRVRVKPALIRHFTIHARLYLYPGMDGDAIKQEALKTTSDWLLDHRKLGHDISLSALYAVLHREGVQRVELLEPQWDITVGQDEAAYCSGIEVDIGGEHV
ncbi:baseplate J/gp47 family protein [Pseudoalteromonas sp. OOF1S-7]|uniref:baseplate assembly protein n=1 Tax=Pseudoalteromonas sp. OOF1S-7 TaxID=2917757 RepID=UPI001EF6E3FD|nr:baseplate J/gp47 family protein [Pseudoalteromonas sp. OOF1S-7]MCG7536504.1 baseplate J/gp47 family protein [Pseudoalteromonas sp. OOF1S-7]